MRSLALLALLAALAASGPAAAQTGKLSGRVTDAAGQAIPGANVVLDGTTTGAATDVNGRYFILNIRPDTYTIRFSAVGFTTRLVEGVRVSTDLTTELDAVLPEAVIEGGEVVVQADRPIVDVTQTSQLAVIGREEIARLPVQDLAEVVNLQAGVVDGHFRGGRLGEVQFQVDGVTVNNPFNNDALLRIDRSLLQEVQVISGTFDAEYGQALSGVVNAVLRDGRQDRLEASAEGFLGDYISPSGPFPELGRLRPANRYNAQASVSGPLGIAGTTFLASGQRLSDEGYLYGRRIFLPTDRGDFEAGEYEPSGDGALLPLGFAHEWGGLAKVTTRQLIPGVRLSYQALFNQAERKNRGTFAGSYAYRLNPDGTRTQRQTALVHGLDVAQALSQSLFYEAAFRLNNVDYSDYAFEDLYDPRYLEAGPPRRDQNFEEGAVLQGVDPGRFTQTTRSTVFKGSVTWQATRGHLLKAGVEGQRARVAFGTPGGFLEGLGGGGFVPNDSLPEFQVRRYTPLQGAAFIQDRIELARLRVRVGLRAEVFDARTTVPSDLQNPANAISGAPESVPVATTLKVAVAPRLGVSFPILETASLFFSWGHFYQIPGLGEFFSNADYSVLRDLQAGAVTYGVMGNPDLRPEFTAQYEFGFKAALAPWLGLDAAVFYKDIRDLLGVEFIDTYAAATYARLTNVDFGSVRGLTLSVDQRRLGPQAGPGVSVSANYTLQLAQGNSSDPRETATRASAGEDPRPRVVPFNWDQRHTANTTVTVDRPGRYAVTAVGRVGSGQPYTPEIGLPGFDASLGTNAGRKPSQFFLDLRAEYLIGLGTADLTAFARAFNVLDARFDNGFVFATTGSPFYTLAPRAQRDQLNDPSRFAAPRRVEVGVTLSWSRALGRR
jgi:outer membrane receptor protein involved in Fe transport